MKTKSKSRITELCKGLKKDFQDWEQIPEAPEQPSPKKQRLELLTSLKKKIDKLSD